MILPPAWIFSHPSRPFNPGPNARPAADLQPAALEFPASHRLAGDIIGPSYGSVTVGMGPTAEREIGIPAARDRRIRWTGESR